MKKTKYILTVLLISFKMLNLYSQHSQELIGTYNITILRDSEKYPWFERAYQNYNVDTSLNSQLTPLINEGVTITIVAGTWCGDTRRELPRFIKILDELNFNEKNLKTIFVGSNKLSPGKPEKKLKVKSVPTFIVYKNDIEKGRIIELPQTTFEQDLLNILSK